MTNPAEKMKLPKCHKCKRETSMLFCSDCVQEAIKYDRKEILEIINQWQNDSIFKYDDECSYCQRNINDWIIKVRELKSKITGEKLK